MSMLTEFQFGEQEIRVVVDETTNEPAWVAKDICDALGYAKVDRALSKLDEDEKLMLKIGASGQNRDMSCINESGLYTLILRSNKPEAKKFKKWVTAEVLPSIRKTGSYSAAPHADSNAVMLEMIKNQQRLTDAVLDVINTQQGQNKVIMDYVTATFNGLKNIGQVKIDEKVLMPQYLDSRDRKKLRDAIQEKAKEVAKDLGVSVSTISPSIWIELKSFFDVDDYQDIHKSQMKDVMHFVTFWEPKKGQVKETKQKPTHEIILDEEGNSRVIPIV